MKVSRRSFLKLAAIATASEAVLSRTPWKAPSLKALEESAAPPGDLAGKGEQYVSSVCLQCDAGCGISVRVVNGRAVKIEGNPLFPTNQGGLCPKGQSGLQVLYDPDRIKTPLKRIGPRGAGQWQRISWTEALDTVVERLRLLRSQGQAHTLIVFGGRYRGQMSPLMARFLEAYGSPNHIAEPTFGSNTGALVNYLTLGINDFLGHDLPNTNYLLSFGASFAEAWRPTVENLRLLGLMRRGRPGHRSKIVQVEPRLSVSATKADEWVPIIPGTDAALALGIAHVLIKDNLYDSAFVNRYTFGFDDWTDGPGQPHEGFKNLVLKDYSPAQASRISGVPAATIERLAREFAANRPAIAVGARGAGGHTNGVYSQMAINSLNALVGSIGTKGGLVVRKLPPLSPLPPLERDATAEAGLTQPRLDGAGGNSFPLAASVSQALPQALLSGSPYQAQALFLYYTNPLFSRPDTARFREALDKVPFIVSFSPFMDESTAQADLVLPDCTYLERLQDDEGFAAEGFPMIGMRRPVVEPLYDTANTGDVIIRIAQQLGGTMARSFPWSSFEEMLRQRVTGVYQAKRGSIVAQSFDDFWQQLLDKGGWWDEADRPAEHPAFPTPSGRFEFYSQTLRGIIDSRARAAASSKEANPLSERDNLLQRLAITARGDAAFMPHYEPVQTPLNTEEFPLFLNTYKTMTHAEGRGANQPWLQEIYGLQLRMKWEPWVEINPQTAQRLGIADGDRVWLETPLGRIQATAKVFIGAMPQVINMPYGFGHTAYGRWASDRGANPNDIIGSHSDPLSGVTAWSSTRVKVYKA